MALFFNIAEGIIRIALSIKGGNIVDCVRLNAGDEIIRILLTSIQCLSPAMEFDNVEGRCSVEKWILYDLLKRKWVRMELGDYSRQIVNTLYGNPLRRAWIELNYIYFYIVREIEAMSFKLFVTEAEWFFSKDEDMERQMKNVKLCDLRLSDMGNTTLGVTAPPYDEIAQEAFSVWELFK